MHYSYVALYYQLSEGAEDAKATNFSNDSKSCGSSHYSIQNKKKNRDWNRERLEQN